jgi:uncharacterized protein with von Willebrand factor type A (vWA) domain
VVDLADRHETYLALRSVLTSRHEDLAIFADMFAQFWNPPQPAPAPTQIPAPEQLPGLGSEDELPSPVLVEWVEDALAADGEFGVPAYSPIEALTRKDFSTFSADELDEILRLVAAIARRVATRVSRRTRQARRSPRVDLRRTIRASLRRGGEIIDLAYRRRRVQKTRVVLLADVSGSMDLYSRFVIQFIYALHQALRQVETFVFSTSLTHVTDALSESTLHQALDEVSRQVPDWSGGTKIGQSLQAFLARYGEVITRRTVVLIISDGWDTGEIETLRTAMQALQRRAGRVVWLNPLLGSPGYEPICQGMQVALPYIDTFAPAHNLESLRQLERHLAVRAR